MKKSISYTLLFLFSLLMLLPFLGRSQATYTAPIGYNTGAPTAAPGAQSTRWRFDLLTGRTYKWSPTAISWIVDGYGIDNVSGCVPPAYTPAYGQSIFAANGCDSLYMYRSGHWRHLNPGGGGGSNISAGAGISISGTPPDLTINADDVSATNELNTALYVDAGSLVLDDAGGSVSVPLSQFRQGIYSAGTGISINFETGVISNTGDLSTTNEIQTLSIAGSDLTLSNGGGTVTIPSGGITSLGGQTGATQTFATGTSGTNFAISSSANTHTFNLPTASASNRGALSSTDWSTFNSKVGGSGTSGQITVFGGTSSVTSSSDLTYASNLLTANARISLPTTTSSVGNILINNQRAVHFYNSNTFVGILAGNFTHTGTENTGIGYSSLAAITSGSYNNAFGLGSASAMTTGSENTAFGRYSLANTTTGGSNVAVGNTALFTNVGGGSNVAIGLNALRGPNGPNNNVAIGTSAMFTAGNTIAECVAIGGSALYRTTGSNNTAIGHNSSNSVTSGGQNTAIGRQSAASLSTGSDNTLIGEYVAYSVVSGSSNTMIGTRSGFSSTGSNNVFIGYQAGYNESGSNMLYVENTNSSTPLIGGNFSSNRVGINTPAASIAATLQVTGSTGYAQLNLATTYTPTGSADALGSNGDVAYDTNYIYIKVGGSWKRAALSTF